MGLVDAHYPVIYHVIGDLGNGLPVVQIQHTLDDHRSNQNSWIERRSASLLGRIMLVKQINQDIPGNLGTQYYPTVIWIQLIVKWGLKSD
jgi:hypothetical protein